MLKTIVGLEADLEVVVDTINQKEFKVNSNKKTLFLNIFLNLDFPPIS